MIYILEIGIRVQCMFRAENATVQVRQNAASQGEREGIAGLFSPITTSRYLDCA